MNLPPISKRVSEYTDDERALIAGFLLRQRQGTLDALRSSERGALINTDIGLVNQVRYYTICEQYSRFLLYWTGYVVDKRQMYATAPSP